MTRDEIRAWARTKEWPRHIALESLPLEYTMDHELGMLVCITLPGYAECQGTDDPVCGRARFSVHGCAGAPSRAEYLAAATKRTAFR